MVGWLTKRILQGRSEGRGSGWGSWSRSWWWLSCRRTITRCVIFRETKCQHTHLSYDHACNTYSPVTDEEYPAGTETLLLSDPTCYNIHLLHYTTTITINRNQSNRQCWLSDTCWPVLSTASHQTDLKTQVSLAEKCMVIVSNRIDASAIHWQL